MERKKIKSCCGGGGYILTLDRPITRPSLDTFKNSGYRTSNMYTKVGVFFVENKGLTASGSFGSTKIQVRCGGSVNCNQLLDDLEKIFQSL